MERQPQTKEIQMYMCDHAWAQAILIMLKHAYAISKGWDQSAIYVKSSLLIHTKYGHRQRLRFSPH